MCAFMKEAQICNFSDGLNMFSSLIGYDLANMKIKNEMNRHKLFILLEISSKRFKHKILSSYSLKNTIISNQHFISFPLFQNHIFISSC